MAVQTKMTAAEFLELPETSQPTELIDGEIIVTAPELDRQDIALDTAFVIKQLMPGGKVRISPVDVYINDFNVLQPDVLWTSPDTKCVPVGKKHLRGAPDLVVEILSPSTALRDKRTKFGLYEKYGVQEYWVIEPTAHFIEVWRRVEDKFVLQGLFGEGETFVSAILGDKTIEVNALFASIEEM